MGDGMDTDSWRRRTAGIAGLLFLLLGIYRVYRPVPGMYTIITLLLLVSTVLFLFRTHADDETLQRVRDARRQLDPYDTLVTTLLTGVMMLLFTYLVTYGLMMAAYTYRRSDLIAQFFFEAIQHVRLFEALQPLLFAVVYIVAGSIVATGVLLIYPSVPIRKTLTATIVTFLAAWMYTLALFSLVTPIIHPLTWESLVLDAALVVTWAYFFDRLYGRTLVPNPFRRRVT